MICRSEWVLGDDGKSLQLGVVSLNSDLDLSHVTSGIRCWAAARYGARKRDINTPVFPIVSRVDGKLSNSALDAGLGEPGCLQFDRALRCLPLLRANQPKNAGDGE